MASTRWDAIQGLVTVLQGITVANGYQHNLNGTGAVTAGVATRSMRLEEGNDVQLQVEEGEEAHIPLLTSPDTPRQATLELKVDCMLRGVRDEDQRQRLNKLLEDVNLAVGKAPTLGGQVQRALVARVDEPTYHPGERVSFVTVRLVVDYHYTAGVDT